ncbi:hypothetical protein TURU_002331 [Turdus rufiventris]|nr:hypothetical protein TURU_002331 [Turdus rufiventris]
MNGFYFEEVTEGRGSGAALGSGLACSDCSAGIPKAIERFRCKQPPDFNGDKGLNFSQSIKTPAQTRTGFTTTVLELGSGLRGHISTKQQFGTGREDEYLIQLKLRRKYHAGCLEGTQQAQPNGSGLRKSSGLLRVSPPAIPTPRQQLDLE